MSAEFYNICWSNLALVGRSHNCIPKPRPSWVPAETPAPAKKPETPAERKPTKAERIEALRVSLHTVTKVGRPPAREGAPPPRQQGTEDMTTRKKPKPRRKPPAAVRAAADRAEARSAGKPMPEPKSPLDGSPTAAELAEAARGAKRKYESKLRLSYTPELGEEICRRMVTRGPTGRVQSLTEVCAADDMPHEESVRRWRKLYPAFAAAYSEAREERAGLLGDEIIEISDSDGDPQRVRNRIAARQWYAVRINRREFGEASVHAVSLTPMDAEGSGSDRDLARRVALVLQKMLARRQAKQLTVEAQPVEDDETT